MYQGFRQILTLRDLKADGTQTASHRCLCPSPVHKHKTLLRSLLPGREAAGESYLSRKGHADSQCKEWGECGHQRRLVTTERRDKMWSRDPSVGNCHFETPREQENLCVPPLPAFHITIPQGLYSGTEAWRPSPRLHWFPLLTLQPTGSFYNLEGSPVLFLLLFLNIFSIPKIL